MAGNDADYDVGVARLESCQGPAKIRADDFGRVSAEPLQRHLRLPRRHEGVNAPVEGTGGTMLRLDDFLDSGNGYKVRLLLSMLGRRFELIELDDFKRAALDQKLQAGHAALGVMEGHLTGRDWFAGGGFTIADIALYAYTHVADEGGFDLEGCPAIRAWLGRVAAQPGHVPITQR